MKIIMAAIVALSSTTAIAQSGPPTVLTDVNKDIWQVSPNGKSFSLLHKKSGAKCPTNFHGLTLVDLTDYAKDGSDSSCQFEKKDESGLTRMTVYLFSAPGESTQSAYLGAKGAILARDRTTGTKTTELLDESKKCFEATVPTLAGAVLAKQKSDGTFKDGQTLETGIVTFNVTYPAQAQRPEFSATTLLSLYKIGPWFVKARVTLPKSDISAIEACRYAALANYDQARLINTK